jgi:hypothetical protein
MYSSKTPDDIMRRLIALTFGGARFTRDEQLAVIRFAIDHGISDGCLCLILIDMGDLGIFESANDVSSAGIDDRYPLAQAICTAFLADDDLDDLLRGIIETLSVTDPSVAADRIVRDFLLVLYPLRIGSFDEAILERLLAQVEGTASMPGWLAVNSYVLLSQIGLMMRPDHASQPRLRAQLERTAADSDAEELRRMAAIAMMAAARYNEIAGEPRPAATLPPAT